MSVQVQEFVLKFFDNIRKNFSNFILTQDFNSITRDWTGFEKDGAHATVTKGTLNGIPVAFKKIQLNRDELNYIVTHKAQLDAIIAELTIMSRIQHPNIPKLHAIIIDEKKCELFLILDFIDGLPLKLLFTSKMNENWAYNQKLWLAVKLSRIILFIKGSGVIHRDVKPDNIIIENDSNLEPVLIDFGLSKLMQADKEVMNTFAKCTPLYSPPENFVPDESEMSNVVTEQSVVLDEEKKTNINFKVDVWSLGCVLYELFTGRAPYDALSKGKELRVHHLLSFFKKKEKIFSPEDKNRYPEIIHIVENCTKHDVGERWEVEQTVNELELLLNKTRVCEKERIENDNAEYSGELIKSKDVNEETVYIYDGLGKLVYTNLESVQVTYVGGFQYGNKYGFGMESSEDENYYYQGEWRNQKKDGDGYLSKVEDEDPTFYKGSFKKGKKHGYGLFVRPEVVSGGYFIDDNLIKGFLHDKEKYIIYKGLFDEGTFYFGEVHNLKTGEIYCGEYKDDMRNGIGFTKNGSQAECVGEWRNNKLVCKLEQGENKII